MNRIRVAIADDVKETRQNIRMLLELDPVIEVVGEAGNGQEAVELARVAGPDVILMDINMPEMDGIRATELISMEFPEISVIIISVQGEQEYLKRAMLAGAQEYLIKPFTADELASTVKRVVELNRKRRERQKAQAEAKNHQPKIVTVFSTKGGVGKTLICTNLAVALARQTGEKVGLVDLDLQFGDVAVMMNVYPKRTIAELMQEQYEIDAELLENYLYERHGVKVLAAPNKPELAELVTPDGVARVLKAFVKNHDYVLVDTPPVFNDTTLVALDASDRILLVATLDLPTVKNIKRSVDILKTLGLLPKVKLVLNRASGAQSIEPEDVERVLEIKIEAYLPSEGKLALQSVNRGQPLVLMDAAAPLSRGVYSMLGLVTGSSAGQDGHTRTRPSKGRGFWSRQAVEV
ncbi:MAG TPA: response regulator [Syntrophothermus lipocalidus]|nr:response regulator [Syntrophothermus lipocalidus]